MKNKLTVLASALVAAALSTGFTGKVTYSQGEITQVSKGTESKAAVGAPVKAGDLFKTGAKSIVIIAMDGGAEFKLNEKSELSIPEKEENVLALNKGSVFSKIPKQKQTQKFKIRTATAVMGVRGTHFFTSYGPEGKAADIWMCVQEGIVDVTSLKGNKTVTVKEGEGILVPVGKDVTAPKRYAWTKELNWNMDPAAGKVENEIKIDYQKALLKEDYN